MQLTTTFRGEQKTKKELQDYLQKFGLEGLNGAQIKEKFGEKSEEFKLFHDYINSNLKFSRYSNLSENLIADNSTENNSELKELQSYICNKLKSELVNKESYDYSYISNLIFNDEKVWAYFSKFKFDFKDGCHTLKNIKKENGEFKTLKEIHENDENQSLAYDLRESMDRAVTLISMGILDEEATDLLVPNYYMNCKCCTKKFIVTFNHANKTIVGAYGADDICDKAFLTEDKVVSKVVTKGKIFVCNDIRHIFNKEQKASLKEYRNKFNKKNSIYADLDSVLGKHMYAYLYSHYFNAAYAIAGNHGCYTNKLSNNNLLFTYGNEEDFPSIILDLWGIFVMDYEDAVKIATENGTLDYLNQIDSNIIEVEPGTYNLVTDFNAQNGNVTKNGVEYFAELVKVSDNVEPLKFEEEKFVNGDWS